MRAKTTSHHTKSSRSSRYNPSPIQTKISFFFISEICDVIVTCKWNEIDRSCFFIHILSFSLNFRQCVHLRSVAFHGDSYRRMTPSFLWYPSVSIAISPSPKNANKAENKTWSFQFFLSFFLIFSKQFCHFVFIYEMNEFYWQTCLSHISADNC